VIGGKRSSSGTGSVGGCGLIVIGTWSSDGREKGDCPSVECPRAKTWLERLSLCVTKASGSGMTDREEACSMLVEVSHAAVSNHTPDVAGLCPGRHEATPDGRLCVFCTRLFILGTTSSGPDRLTVRSRNDDDAVWLGSIDIVLRRLWCIGFPLVDHLHTHGWIMSAVFKLRMELFSSMFFRP
jgi:hypothetical protein